MDKRYACYCGLYCENCATKAKVEPAARILFAEMKKAGFEEIMPFLPGGDAFWPFLTSMAEGDACDACKEGSGNPNCEVRKCAQKKSMEMCAFCLEYPCALIDKFDQGYPILKRDNALLRDQGWDVWGKLQDERRANGFTYTDDKAWR